MCLKEKINLNYYKSFLGNRINFNQINKQLENNNFQRSLKGLLGPELQKEYNGLIRDFSSIHNPYKLLRTATQKGLDRIALEYAAPFILGPKVGMVMGLGKVGSGVVKGLYERMLTNPSIILDWRQGIRYFKQGNYQAAIRSFQEAEKAAADPNNKK